MWTKLFTFLTLSILNQGVWAQCITQNPAPTNQSICQNALFNNVSVTASGSTLTYQWYSNTTNSNSGGTLIVGATLATYSPPSNVVGTSYFYCIVSTTNGTCLPQTSSVSGAYMVNPLADAVTIISPVSGNYCSSVSLNAALPVGSLDQIYWQNTTPFDTSIANPSISQTVSTTGNYYFRAQTSLGCWGTPNSVSITINNPITISQQPSVIVQTVCQNVAFTNVSVTASGSNLSYQWYSNTTNSNSGGSLIIGATLATYSPTSNVVGTKYYYCLVSNTNGSCPPQTSSVSGAFVVNPLADAVTISPLSGNYCSNVSLNAALPVGSLDQIYWQNTTPFDTSIANPSISQTVSTTGNYYFRAQTSLGCWGTPNSVSITINNPITISQQPSVIVQTVCQNVAFTNVSVTASGSNLSYQWYSNTTNSNSGGSLIIGATLATYSPTSNVVGTKYYYCLVSNTNGSCPPQTSGVSGAYVANPLADAVTISPLSGNYCSSVSLNASLPVGSLDQIYWQNITANGTSIANPSISQTVSTTGTYYFRAQTALGCWGTPSSVSITINNPITISQQPSVIGQTVCQNVAFTNVSVTASGSNLSYQWYSNTTNSNSGGSLIIGATLATYSPPSNVVATKYYYCVVSNSNGSCPPQTSSISGGFIVSTPISVTIQPSVNIQTICQNSTFNPISITASGSNIGYQWYSNTMNSNSGGTLIAGATNSSFIPPGNIAGTKYYYCIVSNTNGICSSNTSNVSGAMVVNGIVSITTQPNVISQAVCQNGVFNSISISASGTGLTYQWYTNSINSNTGGSPITNANTTSYIPPSNNTGTVYYYCLVNGLNPCQSQTSNVSGARIVHQPVSITQQPSALAQQCLYESLAALSVVATGSGLSYQWYSNTINSNAGGVPFPGANNVSFTPPNSSAGTIYYYCMVNGLNPCPSLNSTTAIVTVFPLPNVNAGQNVAICSGSITALNAVGAISYSWVGNFQNGSPFIPLTSQMYYVTGIDGNLCSNNDSVQIIVNPLPIVNAGQDISICQGLPITLIASGASAYIWNNSVVNGATFIPTVSSVYFVTGIDVNGCEDDDLVNVTILPAPQLAVQASYVLCQGDSVILTASGANTISWENGLVNGSYYSPLADNYLSLTGSNINNCSVTDSVFFSVLETPIVSAGSDIELCNGQSTTLWASGAVQSTWDNGVINGVPFTPTSSGFYTVSGTNGNGCFAMDSLLITVLTTPFAAPTAIELLGQNVLYAIDSTLDIYQWGYDFGGTSYLACSGSHFCYFPDFNPSLKVYWLDHGNNDECIRRTYYNQVNSIEEDNEVALAIYPNPFSNEVKIENPNKVITALKVMDLRGCVMYELVIQDEEETTILTSNWPSGVYYFFVNNDNSSKVLRVLKVN